jgi:tRNA(fMet)-specific endonuclease VapC
MGLITDTCIFIQAERTKGSINFKKWEQYENAYISAITVSELLIGVHRATTEARRLKRSAFVETIINEVPILNFNIEIARIHAEICAYLMEKGQSIGAHDLIIAATALANDCVLLTNNHQEFNRVPGLNIISN